MNTDQDLNDIWKVSLAQLEVKIDSPAQFKTWFKDTRLISIEGKKATIGVKNSYTCDWLRQRHNKSIQETLSYVYQQKLEPDYVIDKSLINVPTEKVSADDIIKETPILATRENRSQTASFKSTFLNSNFTFDTFVMGPSNKLAHAAAVGTAQNPGTAYNPLFIYGKTGLGKTHLGQAVGLHILEQNPGAKVKYVSSEGFLNDMVKAIKSGKNIQFRERYRTLDLLIIDDIQFLSKWQETQNEFFNTFNVLHNAKKQIILMSDRPPELIENIEDRLRSRFQGGMTVDITRPDYETRIAILQKKAEILSLDLPMTIIEHIAELISDNVRELEGGLQKIALYNAMKSEDLSIEEVASILGKDTKSKREQVKLPKVLKCVAKEYKLSVKDLKGPRRTADIAFARQVCMYILRDEFNYKLEDIAHALNRKDHTTVLHAVDKIQSKLMLEEGFKEQVNMIRESIFAE